MIVSTSPENYQIWTHSDRELSVDEKRFWAGCMNSDPGADPRHRWGRCPGFFNRKEKHRSDRDRFPLAKPIGWTGAIQRTSLKFQPFTQLIMRIIVNRLSTKYQANPSDDLTMIDSMNPYGFCILTCLGL